MKKLLLKNIGLTIFILTFSIFSFSINATTAKDDLVVDGTIIPELTEKEITEVNKKIDEIGKSGGIVMNKYREVSYNLTTSQQLATGIMNRDTIMNYLVFVIQFLSQLGLLVGVIFIMYAGYKYMVSVFEGGKTPSSTIKNAIIGVLIIIFSYAIMKILTSLVGLT